MTALQVLFIGGTGVISAAVTRRAVETGIYLTVLTRGHSTSRPLPDGVRRLTADIYDRPATLHALRDRVFDTVVYCVAFTPDHISRDIELLATLTSQSVFISSASAYQTPPTTLPIRESTPLHNPYWQYSRDKIACESALLDAYRDRGFPITIVRLSHTYD